jgi:hypothetical protein
MGRRGSNQPFTQVHVSLNGTIGKPQTYNGGATAVALSIDPTSPYLFQANTSGDLLAVYTLLETGVKSGAGYYTTGDGPSSVLPSGRFVPVANSADGSISAYSLDNLTGVLTPIAGTFAAGRGPASLAASNDSNYLYAVNQSSETVSVFTINSDGTLTAAGSATTAAGPTSITTVGTYQLGSARDAATGQVIPTRERSEGGAIGISPLLHRARAICGRADPSPLPSPRGAAEKGARRSNFRIDCPFWACRND